MLSSALKTDDSDALGPPTSKVKIGAIRWDAFFDTPGIAGAVGAFCAEAMSAPYFQVSSGVDS